MTNAQQIIAERGGPAKVARALDIPYTTVASWPYAKGGIPPWRIDAVLSLPTVAALTPDKAA
jgi:hypothetical protein